MEKRTLNELTFKLLSWLILLGIVIGLTIQIVAPEKWTIILKLTNDLNGLFTLISVILVLWILAFTESQKKENERKEQYDTLQRLEKELKTIKGTSEGWDKEFNYRKSMPFFQFYNLNATYYLKEINNTILSKKDEKTIKSKIINIQEKIILLNSYSNYLMDYLNNTLNNNTKAEDSLTFANWNDHKVQKILNSKIYLFWRSKVLVVKVDLDKYCTEVSEILDDVFEKMQ